MSLPLFPPVVFIALVVFVCCLVCAGVGILLTRAKVKKKKFINTRIIIALSFAGIITLYFWFYAISNAVGRSSVNTMWEKVEAAGLKTEASQIIPKGPNYYLIDKTIYYDIANISTNAVPLYEASISLLESTNIHNKRFSLDHKYKGNYHISSWTNKDRAEALKLSKYKNVQLALTLFSQGVQKKYAVNKRNYKERDISIKQLMGYREIFRTISFVSNCYAYEGKVDKAYDLIVDGFKFVHQFENEPSFIGQLVYIACAAINYGRLNDLIPKYGISSKKAKKLIKAMGKIKYNEAMKNGLNGELVLSGRYFYENFVDGNIIYNYEIKKSKYKYLDDLMYIYPCIYQDYAQYINFMLEYYKSFDKDFWKVKTYQDLKKTNASLLPFARILLREIIPVRTKVARMNSISNSTKVILALHIYKNEHGKFPERLDALVPDILKEIKVDPVSGKAYSYKKEGEYFKLTGFYSSKK